MLLHCCCLWTVFTVGLTLAQTSSIDINRYPPLPQATACGDIVNANLYGERQYYFPAAEAFDCLTSVPFNPAVALRFLRYLNATLQYHATTAFIRHPPPGYQQPAFDLFESLQDVVDRVNSGVYHNQYAFETDVQGLVRELHDTHAYVSGGINSVMSFFSPFRLASISSNGQDVPQIYDYDELIDQVSNNGPNAKVITQINGVDAVEYMSSFGSKQSFGMLEPNADWNQMMTTPAQELFGVNSFSEAAPFYAGDQLVLNFEDGSTKEDTWTALYSSPGFTGPLATGGDFYNFFVLGNYPANYDQTYDAYYNNSMPDLTTLDAGDEDNGETHTSWNFASKAFPADTIMFQEDLGEFSDGALTGYYLDDISTAILSLPSFEHYGNAIDEFGRAVDAFVNSSIQRNAQKVIIDLQQNGGGLSALAFYVFDKFFPDTRPFAGSRMRSHPDANVLGNAFTSYFGTLTPDPQDYEVQYYQSSEWVVTDRIDALTSTNFTSWDQYNGPLSYRGDNFTLVQQYDLSNPSFVEAALGVTMPPCMYNETCGGSPPWASTNIAILTDGICGSTCSLFVEMMREQGVRTVTVGGRPEQGPMQAASGSRGSTSYSDDALYSDYTNTLAINATAAAILLPMDPPDTGFYGVSIGFTLRDQIRRNQTIPNQVLYLPSDCRLYWTLSNFHNYTRLWQDASNAMFTDSSLCVAGSTNAVAPPSPNATSTTGTGRGISTYIVDGLTYDPSRNGSDMWAGKDFSGVLDVQGQYVAYPESCDFTIRTRQCGAINFGCHKSTFPCLACGADSACVSPKALGVCSNDCFNGDSNSCPGKAHCKEVRYLISRANQAGRKDRQTLGFCEPDWTKTDTGRSCNSITSQSLGQIISKKK